MLPQSAVHGDATWRCVVCRETATYVCWTFPLSHEGVDNEHVVVENKLATHARIDHPAGWLESQRLALEPSHALRGAWM